ncbi:MAG TPA: hypothetical protein VNX26_10655 [Candidatus Acidoferrum sp.]|jgi:hypothetical protein|nr:hypothetical protein [Candidatus Acidoferrum sp.]
MFKITNNTARQFSLAEILLMAAINQIEAKQKVDDSSASSSRDSIDTGTRIGAP